MQMYNIILNPLSPSERMDFWFFVASLIDNIHISTINIGIYVLSFIIILKILTSNFNRLVSNNWSTSEESIYALILKGLLTRGPLLNFFSLLVPYGCPFALLLFLVGWRYNYLDFSLQVVKFKTKFCSSNSGAGNALTARNYSTLPGGGIQVINVQ